MEDKLGWSPNTDFYFSWSSGHNRHLVGKTAVRSINLNGYAPYGWDYILDNNTLYIGEGGFIFNGTTGMWLNGGYLTSLVGEINISLNRSGLALDTIICNNDNIKTGLNISGGVVGIGGAKSNTFTGDVSIKGISMLNLTKTNGAIAISGNMNVKAGAKVISHRSDQIAKHVHVTLSSLGSEPVSQLILENGVQESFRKLTIDGRGIVEFKGSSQLILDDLSVGDWDTLTVVGWEHQKDLFLVRKTSTHVKGSLRNIIFQGESGPVHLEDYNKDYWELTTAPEPATTGAIIGIIIAGITIRRNRLKKRRQSLSASVPI